MRIFTRYVVSEVLKYFFLGLAALTLLVTVGMAVREGLSKGLPPGLIAAIMPYLLPEMLGITIPVTMLFAVTCVFGRMAGTNEIVALKSLGVSPTAVVGPVLILAALISLGTVWMYELAATWSRPSIRRVIVESVEDIAYGMLRTQGSFESSKFSVTVKGVEGRRLIRPTIIVPRQGKTPAVTLTAAEAELSTNSDRGILTFRCTEAVARMPDQDASYVSDLIEHKVLIEKPQRRIHRDWLGMGEIAEEIEGYEDMAAQLRAEIARQATAGAIDEEDQRQLAKVQHRIHRLETEPYRRWSNGFSCLSFVLVGIPVAVRWRSADAVSTFFACFLPILIVYYPLLMLGEELSTSGTLPPWSFWLPNFVVLLPGLWLFRRVMRY